MGVWYQLCWIVDSECVADDEKKMGVGWIVDQNSDKKRLVYGINYVEKKMGNNE